MFDLAASALTAFEFARLYLDGWILGLQADFDRR